MISARYAAPVAILIAFSLVPTFVHSYVGATVSDGRLTAAIPPKLAEWSSRPSGRKASWFREVLASEDWIERWYSIDGRDVLVVATRSYDPKRLYHHPELALVKGVDFTSLATRRLQQMPHVPVHVLTSQSEDSRNLLVYALLYEDRFIDSAWLFQIRTAGELLFSRRKPMTLLLVHDRKFREEAIEQSAAVRLLFEAIGSFMAQRPGPGN